MSKKLLNSKNTLLRAIFKKAKSQLTLVIFICLLMLGVTGCASTYKESFDCAPGNGVGCKSITQVNQLIDHVENTEIANQNDTTRKSDEHHEGLNNGRQAQQGGRILKIWLAPQEDGKGNIFGEQIIHTAIDS